MYIALMMSYVCADSWGPGPITLPAPPLPPDPQHSENLQQVVIQSTSKLHSRGASVRALRHICLSMQPAGQLILLWGEWVLSAVSRDKRCRHFRLPLQRLTQLPCLWMSRLCPHHPMKMHHHRHRHHHQCPACRSSPSL